MDLATGVLLGLGMGVLSGLGLGGGKLLIPVLVFLFSLQQQSAQGVALMAFLPIAALAATVHRREGNVRVDVALTLACTSIVGAVAGAWLATSLPQLLLRKAYGIFLLCIAVYEFFNTKGT